MRIKLLVFGLCIQITVYGQSDNQNYVQETLYLDSAGAKITNVNYYNGLGDLVETASTGSGTTDNVYTFTTYDSKGRVSKAYYAAPVGSSLDFKDSESFRGACAAFYDDDFAYTQSHYDVADRIVSEDIAGKDWHAGMRRNVYEYGTNTTADQVVIYNDPVVTGSSARRYYPAGSLEKKTVVDADGNQLIVFLDLDGNTILERRSPGDTYFVYNKLGQLRYVLSPEYQNHENLGEFAYQYDYDTRGNLVRKTLPGCEYVQYWYDKENHLVFEQDAQLRAKGLYRFYLYDGLGRVAVTGTCIHCRTNIQYAEARVNYTSSAGILNTGYDYSSSGMSDLVTSSGATVEKICYYDNYSFLTGFYKADFDAIAPVQRGGANGLPAGVVTRTTNGQLIFTVNGYDPKGNLTYTATKGLDGYVSSVASTYSLTNNVLTSSAEVNVKYGEKFKATKTNTYSTRNNLPVTSTLSLLHGSDTCSTAIRYDYDAVNRLHSFVRPGNIGTVSYGYDLHGWLTKIETGSFKEYLTYAGGSSKPCFNGNISTVSWRDACSSTSRGYRFFYDSLNRMTGANYGEGESLAMSPGRYDETAEYDRNGNITKLERHGMKQDGSFGIIDNLKVSLMGNRIAAITDDAEKIIRQGAMDFKTASDGRASYTYNAFGALTSDTGRGITMIQYDNFHNPIRIQFANGSVTRYVYSADGAKLRTVHYTAMPNITVATGTIHELTPAETQAVDSVDYLLGGKLLLRNGRIDKYLFEGGYCEAYKPVTCIAKPFIPTFDGFIEPSKENRERFDDLLKAWGKAKEANFNMDNFNYYFYNTDHQGNIREVVDATGQVVQSTHYYPFGMPITDRHSAINPDLQPFKYNGKELDMMHGLNTYDYGARQYDPTLGRWDRMDPMCEKYYSVSPYAYCGNNPMNAVDPDGRDVLIWYQDKQGIDRSFLYNGTQKMVPNNSFVLDFVHTYNYLKANKIGENVVNAVNNPDVLIEVQRGDITMYQNYDRRHTVFWEPRKGLLLTNGKKQSPAVRLEHEFDHGMDDLKNHKDHEDRKDIKDSQYDNKEERRVVTGSETKTAKKLHQGVRTNHDGKTYPVKDPRYTN